MFERCDFSLPIRLGLRADGVESYPCQRTPERGRPPAAGLHKQAPALRLPLDSQLGSAYPSMAASLRPSMALSRTTGSARAFATTPVPPSRSLLSHNTATRTHTMAIATCTASFLQSTRHLASFSAASPARSCHEKSLHWGRRRSCLVTAASAQATSTGGWKDAHGAADSCRVVHCGEPSGQNQ